VNNPPADIDIPLVYITMETRENLSIVSVDNYQGGRMAMSHLLQQGCRKIGHISGPLDWWEARERRAAWKDALSEAGLDASDQYCVEGTWSSASGALGIEILFHQYTDMDAIFVANDQMALGVLQFFADKKVRIPEEIAIVGFDNISESAFFYPPLTTVQQDQHLVAKVAVEEMIKIIEAGWQGSEPVQPQSIILHPTLVVRKSSLRIPKGGDEQKILL
jgi:LacI family transcriptional regulator